MNAIAAGGRQEPVPAACLEAAATQPEGVPRRHPSGLSLVAQELPATWCSAGRPGFLLAAGPRIEPGLAILPPGLGPLRLLAGSVVRAAEPAPCCGSSLLIGVSGGDSAWRHLHLHRHFDAAPLLPAYLRDAYPPGPDSGSARLGGLMLGWAQGQDGVVSRVARLLWLEAGGAPLGWSYLPRPPLTLAAVVSDLRRDFSFSRPPGGGPWRLHLLDADPGGPALAVAEHLDRYGAAVVRWLDVYQAALLRELAEVG